MDFLETMPFYWYVVGASACLVLIAIILYFVPGGRLKIPAIASCILFSFVGGVGVGGHRHVFRWLPLERATTQDGE